MVFIADCIYPEYYSMANIRINPLEKLNQCRGLGYGWHDWPFNTHSWTSNDRFYLKKFTQNKVNLFVVELTLLVLVLLWLLPTFI